VLLAAAAAVSAVNPAAEQSSASSGPLAPRAPQVAVDWSAVRIRCLHLSERRDDIKLDRSLSLLRGVQHNSSLACLELTLMEVPDEWYPLLEELVTHPPSALHSLRISAQCTCLVCTFRETGVKAVAASPLLELWLLCTSECDHPKELARFSPRGGVWQSAQP
jgi:hypothetical protein